MAAVAEPEAIALQHAATAIINEVGNTLLSSWTAPCELGWLGSLCGAGGIDGGALLRCNACKRLVLAARAVIHAQQCEPPCDKPAAGKQVGTATASIKRSREPAASNGTSKAANRRVSDSSAIGSGGSKAGKALQSAAVVATADADGRPTKLSKVSYPEAGHTIPHPSVFPQPVATTGNTGLLANAGQAAKSAALATGAGKACLAGHGVPHSLVPYAYVPRGQRSQRQRRSTVLDVSWMLRGMDPHHPPALLHAPAKAATVNQANASKKVRLSVMGGNVQKAPKVKMLDGLVSAQIYASATGQAQLNKQQSNSGAGTGGAKQSLASPTSGQRSAQQGRAGGKAQALHGAALKASLANQARAAQHAAAGTASGGVCADTHHCEDTAHPAAAAAGGVVGLSNATDGYHKPAASDAHTMYGAAAVLSNGAGSHDQAGMHNSYLEAQRKMREELAKRLSAPQGAAAATSAGPQNGTSAARNTALGMQPQQQSSMAWQTQAASRQASSSWGGAALPGNSSMLPHPTTLARTMSVGGHTPSQLVAAHQQHVSPVGSGMHHAAGMMMATPGLHMPHAAAMPMAYSHMMGAMAGMPMLPANTAAMHAHMGQPTQYLGTSLPYMTWPGAHAHAQDVLGKPAANAAAVAAHKAGAQHAQQRPVM